MVATVLKKRAETICWQCKNANGNGCEWFKEHLPVRGWIAARNDIDGNDSFKVSFRVFECPEFERGKVARRA
ncbi:MAG: hypothetical protein FWF44_02025 [Defluviitaleaceae bacterium]|nr:hypothetical protein [Defluviitaleaceae bacterium]